MNNKQADRLINVFVIIIVGIVLFFTVARLFFGADLSDEAYAVAETYMVSKGALPFVNNWSQMPGFTLLLAPFLKLYTLAAGGTDGIFLFFRFLSFTINVMTAITISYLLKGYMKSRKMLVLCSLIYVGATGWDYVAAFRGDRLGIDILAIGAVLIVKFFVDDKNNVRELFFSGVFMALSVLSYPTFAVVLFYFIIAMVFLCHKQKKGYKSLLFFIAGAAFPTIIVIMYLSINSGFFDIFRGIRYLLDDVAYFQLENDIVTKLISYFEILLKQVLYFYIFCSVCFTCIIMIEFTIFKNRTIRLRSDYLYMKRIDLQRVILVSLIGGICFYHFFLILRNTTADNMTISLMAMTIETFAVPLVWFFIKKEKHLCNYLMAFIWFPTYVGNFATGIFTYNDMLGRHTLLKNAAFLLGVFVYFAICDLFVDVSDHGNSKNSIDAKTPYRVLAPMLPVVMMTVVLFTYLFNAYTYVYRDESIWRLDTVVSSGPYQGMRTTDERAKGLVELEKIIDSYVTEDDYVLVVDTAPYIYLMSAGKICTPSTWDQTLYSHGFDQPDLYYDYFEVTKTKPTKIIYLNIGHYEIMSIDVEHKFNEFVSENYKLIYEDRNMFEWNYCGREVRCEALVFDKK